MVLYCKISDLWLLRDELGLEVGRWKLGQTLPPYPQTLPLLTTYPVPRIPKLIKLYNSTTLKPSHSQTQLIKFKNLKPNSYIWKIKKIYAKNISTVRESYQSVP